MDWTPSGDMGGADFASAFGTGSLHHQESSASIKMEPDYLDQSHNLMDAVSHHQHQQPALPPRPSDSVMMGDHGMSDSHNMASSATSPMPIHHHQQPSSPAPQAHSQSHSQPPPQAHFAAFDTASHTNPFATGNNPFVASNHTASTDAADIFGSLDGFVAPNQHHHHHHHLSPSPMASSSSPAPPTPAPSSAAATTAGFASWVPPPQQAQPQSQPRQLSQTNPFVQHHLTPQPFTPQSFAPSPAANGHPARINSPGAGYFGSVSSTPAPHVQQQHVPPPQPQQPPSVAMNQFILEMDRASSAATPAVKGKTPVKPPKPRAHRPSVPGSSRMVLSPAAPSATALLKQEAPSMQQQQSPMSVPPVPVKEPTPQPSVAAAAASRPHAREQVSAEAWEEHKDQIHDLYLEQRKPLKEVMAIMADKHNFHAT